MALNLSNILSATLSFHTMLLIPLCEPANLDAKDDMSHSQPTTPTPFPAETWPLLHIINHFNYVAAETTKNSHTYTELLWAICSKCIQVQKHDGEKGRGILIFGLSHGRKENLTYQCLCPIIFIIWDDRQWIYSLYPFSSPSPGSGRAAGLELEKKHCAGQEGKQETEF